MQFLTLKDKLESIYLSFHIIYIQVNHIHKFYNLYSLLAYLSALFPAGGMMIGIGYLDSTELSIVLVCLGLYGLTATYRSGSITNQVEIGPK